MFLFPEVKDYLGLFKPEFKLVALLYKLISFKAEGISFVLEAEDFFFHMVKLLFKLVSFS